MSSEPTDQLDLLAIFHFIVGGIMALFSCMPFLHVFMGIMFINGGFTDGGEAQGAPPDAWFGWMFVIMGSIFILLGWLISIAIIIAGTKLKKRQSRVYCLVMAGIECMFMPFGTVLGVFTLIALTKDPVKEVFDQERV